ncbi:hypothetical protein K2Z84_09560, partial [Candidatus Binatia bacterium]|nr:hypothetical protein [Candidatus Binatia bacterium]
MSARLAWRLGLLLVVAIAVVVTVRRHARIEEAILATLSLRQRLAQLLVVRFDGPLASPAAITMVHDQQVGGVVLYAKWGNVVDEAQLVALTTALRAANDVPPVVAVDQEGGRVDRLAAVRGARPPASALAR